MKLASIALSGALVLAAPWQPVRAAHSYATCTGYVESLPATISTPGHWCLRRDLSIAQDSGAAITIVANNVTLDCNDFKLDGLSAGLDTLAFGVLAQERANTTVRRCVVRGFYVGVRLVGGGHLVEDNRFVGNTHNAIWTYGNGTTIRRNHILDTGGGTQAPYDVALETSGAVDLLDNTIAGVAPSANFPNAYARGVRALRADGSVIAGNLVRDLVAVNDATYAINVSRWPAYTVNNTAVTWTQARDQCIAAEGHLAVVDNAEETALYGSLGATFWIGGSDAAQEGTWRWTNGQAFSYKRWAAGQPDNAGGLQDALALRSGGTWTDENAAIALPYICEFDEQSAPVVVRGNTVIGNNAPDSYGIRGACLARDNVISGVQAALSCTDGGGNQIAP
jgi:hypothetical protein